MFKIVVLSAVVCFAVGAPAPGYLAPATSYASRVDVIHSAPIVKTYAAPIVTKTIVAAPAISYHAPIVSSYGIGLEGHGYHDIGLGHGYGGLGYGYGHL